MEDTWQEHTGVECLELQVQYGEDLNGVEVIGVGILDLQQGHFDSTKFLIGGVTRDRIKGAEAEIYN